MLFKTKVGNTRKALKATLGPIDGFNNVKEVYFSLSDETFNNVLYREVNIWNAPDATVIFTKDEIAYPGIFKAEFHVEYEDGKVEIFPDDGNYIEFVISPATGEGTVESE